MCFDWYKSEWRNLENIWVFTYLMIFIRYFSILLLYRTSYIYSYYMHLLPPSKKQFVQFYNVSYYILITLIYFEMERVCLVRCHAQWQVVERES